ncbi:MAG: hypothetical protein QXZ14_11410 [Candidatus Jordarchaeales archaeon]
MEGAGLRRKTQLVTLTIILALLLPTLLLLPNQVVTPLSAPPTQTQPKTTTPPQDAAPWWNTTFKYRIPINVSVSAGINATIPVDVYIDFQALGVSCHNSSLRVQLWNGSSWLPQPGLPYQIWNETTNTTGHVLKATITFHANVTSSNTTYYIYFNDSPVNAPSFTPQVNATTAGTNIIVNGKYYKAYINEASYGGKIFECYNTFYEGNWSQTPFHNNPTFTERWRWLFFWFTTTYTTSGSPSSVSLNYSSGPLFVTVKSSVPFRSGSTTLNTYANVTYRFFEWGWMCETTTVFQESFSSSSDYVSSYLSCGYSFDPGIMPNLIYKTSGNRVEEQMITGVYSLGSADWFCTLGASGSGIAAGIVDVEFPQFNVTSPSSVSWSFTVNYSSGSESWYRTTTISPIYVNPGDLIRECYAFYVWNGTQGSSPFELFAEAVKSRSVSVGGVEERFFNLTVHAVDKDDWNLNGALIEVRNATNNELLLSKTANETGHATFYLYEGSYNVCVTWNETHEGITYQTYVNSTQITLTGHQSLNVTLNVVNLVCHVIYPSGSDFPYINVTITNASGLVSSGKTNATGYIHFRLPPNTYNISLYEDSQPRNVNGSSYLTVPLSSNASVLLICTDYAAVTKTNITIMNGTSLTCTWTPYTFLLVANWTFSNGTFVNRSANSTYYFKYRVIDSSSGQTVLDWTNLTQSGLCYVADLTGLLFGGKTYTVEFLAGGVGLEMVTNHTAVAVLSVKLNESNVITPVLWGLHYWNHTDIPLVVRVYDDYNGFPVVGANVTWSIEGFGCFQLTDNEDGNYTGFIPKDLLPPGYYTVIFRVECTNYTAYTKDRPISISARPVKLSFTSSYDVFFGDEFVFYVYCTDNLTGAPLLGAQVNYMIEGTDFFGSLVDEDGDGNYTCSFDASLLPSNVSYSVRFSFFLANYSLVGDKLWLFIRPIPMAVQSVYVSDTRWRETLNLTVTLWDTHNNVLVTDALVNCTILKDGSVVLVAELTSLDNGTYTLSVDTQNMLPGRYTAIIYAYKGNYSAQPRQVDFEIMKIAASVTPTSFTALGGFPPYLVLTGGYGEVENSVPFVVLVFEYKDAYGNPVPGATVTANGVPLTYIGDGRYILVVPTSIPPSTVPLVITASAENYESAQTFQVLTVKERGVTIPGLNARVPLTMFAVLSLAVISPPASLAGYVYVRRLRTPPIIRKIDRLIEAIEKGEPFVVEKPLTRMDMVRSFLWEEMALIGVEPRVVAYVPAEIADKLVPLLVESGLSEDVAVALLGELRANPPAERERLLASVGIPPDISAVILRELEREEEERK